MMTVTGNNNTLNQQNRDVNEDVNSFRQLVTVTDQSIESAFETLNLTGVGSSSPSRFPSPSPSTLSLNLVNGNVNGNGNGDGDGFLQWLRVRDAVNGQMNNSFSRQVNHSNAAAGMLSSWTDFPTASHEIYTHNGLSTSKHNYQLGLGGSYVPAYPTATEIYPRDNYDLLSKPLYQGFGGNYLSPLANRRRAVAPVNQYPAPLYNRQRPIDVSNVPLSNLRGNIVYLAKNHHGCRLLQANLEGPTEEEIDWVLAEILYYLEEIMCDQFGNYFFQKVIKVANERQRTQIAIALNSSPVELIAICRNPHGTRAVQKFLENINTQYQISLVMSALSVGAVILSTDPNGHHVMQHCLKRFPFEDNEVQYLIYEMTNNCYEISTNKSGCCVMQTCVDFSRGKARKDLIYEIIINAIHLAEDPYGNYVVQHLLDLKTHEVTEELLRQLEGFHVALSCNKYASNVVQKCMEDTEEHHSSRVLMECVTSPHLSRLLNDPYGNYVVQAALNRFKGPILKNLLNLIRQNAASMRNNMYGKKILDLVQEMKLGRVLDF